MKLVKVEKDFCPACNQVGEFLKDTGVAYDTLNIQAGKDEDQEKARELLQKVGLFTVPVTFVLDGEGEIVDHARGVDRGKLQELVDLVK
jgi:glutaredoxin